MKKFTLLLAFIAFSVFSFAQIANVQCEKKSANYDFEKISIPQNSDKNAGDIFWEEDFDSLEWDTYTIGTMPEGWSIYDGNGEGYYWRWSLEGPRGAYTSPDPGGAGSFVPNNTFPPLYEGTHENGFIMLEADYFNTAGDGSMVPAPVGMDSYFQIDSIDLSAAPGVTLQYKQMFRWCCNASNTLSVFVSADYDPGNPGAAHWTEYDTRINTPVNEHAFTEERFMQHDITSVAAGQQKVTIRFHMDDASHYYWIIDDIKLVEPNVNDIVLDFSWFDYIYAHSTAAGADPQKDWNGGYTMIPEGQEGEFVTFRAAVTNFGIADQTNVVLNAHILKNDIEIESMTSTPLNINTTLKDTLIIEPSWTPPGLGYYQVSTTVTMDLADQDPSNNGYEYKFWITDSTFSRSYDVLDNYGSCSTNDLVGGGSEGDALAIRYDVIDTVDVTSISIHISDDNDDNIDYIEAGDFIMVARLYTEDEGLPTMVPIISSAAYILQVADTGAWITLDFLEDGVNQNILPGVYYATVEFYKGDGHTDDRFRVSEDLTIPQPKYNMFYQNSGEWKYSSSATNAVINLNVMSVIHDVTFNVDMNGVAGFNPASDTVYISGSMMEWAEPGTNEEYTMTDTNVDGIYTIVLQMGAGDYEYKYFMNAGWDGGEWAGDPNRTFTVTEDMTLNNIWSILTYNVTFSVDNGTAPIEGAIVELTGYGNQTTNSSGIALFTDVLLENDIVYTVNAAEYDELVDSVSVVDQDVVENVSMILTSYSVTFTINDGTDPIEGAVVTLTGYGTQTTDLTGIAVFDSVFPETDISYTVDATGFEQGTGTVTVIDQNVDIPAISMTLITYTVTFTVDDGTNTIEGATVTLAGYTNQTTNASGVATFTEVLPETDIVYTVNAIGYVGITDSLSVVNADVDEAVTLNPTYTVTFNVDMNNAENYTPGTDTVYFTGNMVGWTIPGDNADYIMTDTDEDGIYTIALTMAAGDYEYKYFMNAGWDGGEWGGYDNRTFTVSDDMVINDVWAIIEFYTVTFTVDDGTNAIEGTTVTLEGYTNQTTNVSGVAIFTVVVPETDIVYTVNATGYVGITDSLSVVNADVDKAVTLNPTYTVTFNVDMNNAENFTPGTDTVYFTGNMVGWTIPGDNADYIMTDTDEDGIYTIALTMAAGDYEYKYFMNAGWDGGEWSGYDNRTFTVIEDMTLNNIWGILTYNVTFTVDDGTDAIEGATVTLEGYTNQTTNASGVAIFTVVVPETDIVYTVNATGFVQETGTITVVNTDVDVPTISMIQIITYTVIFNVDMNNAENFTPGTDTVYFTGNMVGWTIPGNNADYIMTDTDEDGIYTIALTMAAGDYEYKYFMNAGWDGGEWSGYDNRTFTVSDDMVINDVWGIIEFYTVTFTVDDGTNPIEGANVFVNNTDLYTNAAGIVTIDLSAGDYPYTVDATGFVQGTGTVTVVDTDVAEGVSLTLTTYTVTFVVSDTVDLAEGAVVTLTGYGEQTTDATGTAVFTEVTPETNIVYTIDLTGYEQKAGTVTVVDADITETVTVDQSIANAYPVTFIVVDETAASIEGAVITLTGYGEQTTDATGTAIFTEVTLADDIAYTIIADGYVTIDSTVSVVNAPVTVNIVMLLVGINELTTNGFSIYPNPSKGIFNIKSKTVLNNAQLLIRDINGKLILSQTLNSDNIKIDISNSPAGIYLLQIITDNKIINHKILLK